MTLTFSGLLDLVKGLFSRQFWFGSFLPLASFTALNIGLVALAFPGAIDTAKWLLFPGDGPFTNSTLTFVGLVVLAYAISPLLPIFRGIFEGELLPAWLHDRLVRDRRIGAWRIVEARRIVTARFDVLDRLDTRLTKELQDARNAAPKSQPTQQDLAAFQHTRADIAQMIRVLARGEFPATDDIDKAAAGLVAALKLDTAQLGSEIGRCHDELLDALRFAAFNARGELEMLEARHPDLNTENPQATRIADIRARAERYAKDMYNVEFGDIWPRVQLVMPKDDPFIARIDMAEGQVDFSALSLVLCTAMAVTWPVLLIAYRFALWQFLLAAAAAPLAIVLFYQLLAAAQRALGEVSEPVIDSNHIALLTKVMLQSPPATLFAERALWGRIRLAQQPGTGTDLVYRYPPANAPS